MLEQTDFFNENASLDCFEDVLVNAIPETAGYGGAVDHNTGNSGQQVWESLQGGDS
jgi:hypothetical protein